MTEITPLRDTTLEEDETIIERGLHTFLAVGGALLRIREGTKCREGGYATFAAYCQGRWQLTARHANRLMDAAEVVREIGPLGPLPATESRARELARLPDARARRAVWRAVIAEHGADVTAAKVHDAARAYRQCTEQEAIIDHAKEALDALATIYRDGCYRETHATFGAYCRERWDLPAAVVQSVMGGEAA